MVPPPSVVFRGAEAQRAPGLPGFGSSIVNCGEVKVSQWSGFSGSPRGLSTLISRMYSPFFTVLVFWFFSA